MAILAQLCLELIQQAGILRHLMLERSTYALTEEEARKLEMRVAKVFQPRTPINTQELFAGR